MAERLPDGVVTFVFTDIEGSTRLYRTLGEVYVDHLDRHNELMRAAWTEFGGAEVKTEGDAFFVAFERADQAIRACVSAQKAMVAESWPEGHPFKVRMGIHTGVAHPRDGDYIAFSVHEAARIAALGHGGQTVVSPASAELVIDQPDIELHNLGQWRVRDFDEPVTIYQAQDADLPDEFPSLRTRPAEQHNLRPVTDAFVGRDTEFDALAELFDSAPWVTLVGPGGIGKTRTATEFGLSQVDRWTDGVWFSDLTGVGDLASLRDQIQESIGVRGDWEEVVADLSARRCLLILDNCEQVAELVANLGDELLRAGDGLNILATSREPLHSSSERVWRLAPLDPDEAGVALFMDRAERVQPGFAGDLATVAAICQQVDGLPIAIELAAARVSIMTVAEILDGLDDALRLLRTRRRDVDERQRTIVALLDWSYGLLDPEEQAAFRRLSLFSGSFGLDAAVAVAEGPDVDALDVADLVWTLADKSLVVADMSDGATRYRLLAPIRSYGRAKLDEAGEALQHGSQLGRWYTGDVDPTYFHDHDAVSRIEPERSTMLSLVTLLAESDVATAQLLAWTLTRWSIAAGRGGDTAEDLTSMLHLLARPGPCAVDYLAELAFLLQDRGEMERAEDALDQADQLMEAGVAPLWGSGRLGIVRAQIAVRRGQPAVANEIAELALPDARPEHQVSLLNVLAAAASEAGDDEAMRDRCSAGVAAAGSIGWLRAESTMLGGLVEACLRLADTTAARETLQQSFVLNQQLGTTDLLCMDILAGARLASLDGAWPETVELDTAGRRLLADTGKRLYPRDQMISDELMAEAEEHLGTQRVAEIKEATSAVDLVEATRLLAKILDLAGHAASAPAGL